MRVERCVLANFSYNNHKEFIILAVVLISYAQFFNRCFDAPLGFAVSSSSC